MVIWLTITATFLLQCHILHSHEWVLVWATKRAQGTASAPSGYQNQGSCDWQIDTSVLHLGPHRRSRHYGEWMEGCGFNKWAITKTNRVVNLFACAAENDKVKSIFSVQLNRFFKLQFSRKTLKERGFTGVSILTGSSEGSGRNSASSPKIKSGGNSGYRALNMISPGRK